MYKNTRSTRVWGLGVVNLDMPIYFKISVDMLILTGTRNNIDILPLKAHPYLAMAVPFFNTNNFAGSKFGQQQNTTLISQHFKH